MVKNKGFIILDPFEDKSLLHIFNDLQTQQTVIFNYKGKKDIWSSISKKIGIRCKELIDLDDPLFFPTSSSRYHNLGFITRPKDVEIGIIPNGKKIKVLFDRKNF